MNRFKNAEKVGLRDRETKELIAVYPDTIEGTDEEIEKSVKDWYYKQSCESEERLLTSYVDVVTENELNH